MGKDEHSDAGGNFELRSRQAPTHPVAKHKTSRNLLNSDTKIYQKTPKSTKNTKIYQKNTKNQPKTIQPRYKPKLKKLCHLFFLSKKIKGQRILKHVPRINGGLNLRYHLLAWGQKDKLFTNKSTVPTHAGVSRYTCYWQLHLGDNK